jgi:ribosome modulation factor
MTVKSDAYNEGFNAYCHGVSCNANPYDAFLEESQWDDWNNGWADAALDD